MFQVHRRIDMCGAIRVFDFAFCIDSIPNHSNNSNTKWYWISFKSLTHSAGDAQDLATKLNSENTSKSFHHDIAQSHDRQRMRREHKCVRFILFFFAEIYKYGIYCDIDIETNCMFDLNTSLNQWIDCFVRCNFFIIHFSWRSLTESECDSRKKEGEKI